MQDGIVVQSNSIRGEALQNFIGRVIDEILADISPAFGPAASDYFLMKDNVNYYTRDGMEIMESVKFDNALAKQIHLILFQASYNQSKKVGDGTTTLAILYCYLYKEFMAQLKDEDCSDPVTWRNINYLRNRWKALIKMVKDRLRLLAQPMTPDLLLSMLYTCTQDANLASTIYDKLRDPLMAGAYIIPRKSNIASDFEMTTYTTPVFKATKQFTIRDTNKFEYASFLYCNGTLDIVHYETLLALLQKMLAADDGNGNQTPILLNIILICHGVSERTRQTLKELSAFLRTTETDIEKGINNLTIFTLDEYRQFSAEELEDVATILTDEPGIGGLVQPLTYESYLYQAFYPLPEGDDPLADLRTFDTDPHIITRFKEIFTTVGNAEYDPTEGLKIDRELGPVAQARYNQLRDMIDNEKSEIHKVELNKRLRRSFGMFIDIQVGSALLKDSQRKFELVLDAIVSASTGVREGVLVGNSILHTMRVLDDFGKEISEKEDPTKEDSDLCVLSTILFKALAKTISVAILNDSTSTDIDELSASMIRMVQDPNYNVAHFNLSTDPDIYWIPESENTHFGDHIITGYSHASDDNMFLIHDQIVEPFGIMSEILENSIVPLELLKTKVFHISGVGGFMNNFID